MAWVIKYKGFPGFIYKGPDAYLTHPYSTSMDCWVKFEDANHYATHEKALEALGQTVAVRETRARSCTLAWRGVSKPCG